jgi:hypothetical protein
MEVTLEGATARVLHLRAQHDQAPAYFLVTPNLFATLRTPIVHGRDFTDRDTAAAPWVAIVNEACARRFWPGEDPVGKRLTLDTVPEEQSRQVIGVVRDIPTTHAGDPQPVIYASVPAAAVAISRALGRSVRTDAVHDRPAGDPSPVMASRDGRSPRSTRNGRSWR